MTRPLSGLLVVSLEQAVAAPYCSSRLADAGARVIKIERAEGDFARGYDKAAKGLSSYFVWLNRGKQSLAADIKRVEDAALLHRILARADVFIPVSLQTERRGQYTNFEGVVSAFEPCFPKKASVADAETLFAAIVASERMPA